MVVDSVGFGYMVLVAAWIYVVRMDGALWGPVQALRQIARDELIGLVVIGIACGVAIGWVRVPLAGVAAISGFAIAAGVIVLSRRVPGRPAPAEVGWPAARWIVLWIAMVVAALLGGVVYVVASEAVGGALS
ncbi:putative protein OS=Tsukamurella paurometabola (strain ATCC 8368 / DSM / CCUG 35730 /CIP 100753 / JCM 10117 / KCTC 9821 / NBRC 16120 / NCIMB 702349/ NCTC 13040) OX=521096 GN=Tpau_1328 PE=4 SV=1 [Tsukamurella paurometabola]|uniref:Uncharacterized protein n=2 Tax=Tsukamurella paurometabola TaxID=2061 RepID=D5UWT5_TSUPD|nr:hypothetical protein [Tsukamurella paurometabola]ADG77957.1 hypothetical protein Tpau_1328 [Tsukamurella paurometabola DSM 20162]SUP29517.1 Uncharacterised protein [Tsukamurella paurometabola]